MRHDEAGGGF